MDDAPPHHPGRAALVAIVLFLALAIAGLGVASLLLDESVIAAPGLGQLPGVLALAAAGAAVSLASRRGVGRGGILTTVITATAGAYLTYVLVLGLVVAAVSSDLGRALAVAGRAATAWPGLVVAGSALCASALGLWAGAGTTDTAQWPWEREDPEE